MVQRRRRHMWEVQPIFWICTALAAFILVAAMRYGQLEAQIGVLNTGWSLSGEEMAVLPPLDMRPAGEASCISMQLGEEFRESQTLCFYTMYEDVRVRIDGEEVYRFGKPRLEQMIKAAPNYWNTIALSENCDGSVLEIEVSTPYPQYANMIPKVYYGNHQQISSFVMLKTVPRFAAAMAILVVGMALSLAAIFMRYHMDRNTGLYSLSMFIVVMAIFLISQQTTILLNIYGQTSYILIQHIALMLCPVMYTRYLMRVQTGIERRIARALNSISIVNLVVISALQMMRIWDMPQMMMPTRVLCTLTIIYVFLLELRQKKRVLICLFALILGYTMVSYYINGSITWLIYVGIFAYIFLIVYRVIYAVVLAQTKEIRLEAELQVSRSEIATIQITSHFFYHTLDSIRALIRMDADKAYKMTGDFAKYVRYRVDGVEGMEETVSFSRELRSIRAYADIKQAQLGERFHMIYDVETEDFEILPLTVQPLVENAVIHAVQRRRDGGEVRLVCRETEKGYHIEVIDNGPGPNAKEEQTDAQKKSTAIHNVNTRLEFHGIAPLQFRKNELGGMTVSLDTPKTILRKG